MSTNSCCCRVPSRRPIAIDESPLPGDSLILTHHIVHTQCLAPVAGDSYHRLLGAWFGGPDAPALLRFAEAEGQLLYGTPFWRKPSDAAYTEGFGTDDSERDFRTLADTIS